MRAGSNVVSVAEHVVMQILALVRNYIPAYRQVIEGNWDIGQIAQKCATPIPQALVVVWDDMHEAGLGTQA